MKSAPRLRILLVALFVALLMTVVLASASANGGLGASQRGSGVVCGPAGVKTVVTGRIGRIYQRVVEEELATFGCLEGLRPRRLDLEEPPEAKFDFLDPTEMVLHAPWAAYSQDLVGVDTGQMTVGVKNLRTGTYYRCPVGYWSSAAGTWTKLTGLVVTKKGNVGWIGEREEFSGTHGVVAACERSKFRALDSDEGEGIDPHSLRLQEPRLFWSHSGATRSAKIR